MFAVISLEYIPRSLNIHNYVNIVNPANNPTINLNKKISLYSSTEKGKGVIKIKQTTLLILATMLPVSSVIQTHFTQTKILHFASRVLIGIQQIDVKCNFHNISNLFMQ